MKTKIKLLVGYVVISCLILAMLYFLMLKGIGEENDPKILVAYMLVYLIYGFGGFLVLSGLVSSTLWYRYARVEKVDLKIGFKIVTLINFILIICMAGTTFYLLGI